MGRTIKIILDDEQRTELENNYRSGDNYVFRQRCQMLLLKAEGRKSQDIAGILGCCEETINGWLWRYKANGIKGLKTKAGQGRVSILQISTDAETVKLSVAEHRQRISQAQSQLETSLGKRFSEKTLRRFLKNCVADINESENVSENRKAKSFTNTRSRF